MLGRREREAAALHERQQQRLVLLPQLLSRNEFYLRLFPMVNGTVNTTGPLSDVIVTDNLADYLPSSRWAEVRDRTRWQPHHPLHITLIIDDCASP